jgi:3-oxoacyl-[acyl-carrier protein] reductase
MAHSAPSSRVALVTGAGGAIGGAIANRLAADGVAVVTTDLSLPLAEETARAIRAAGGDAAALAADVTNEDSVRHLFEELTRQHDRLDILVNSAGLILTQDGKVPKIAETPLSFWTRSLDVNLTGVFLVCRAAIPLLRRSAAGRVVNIASLVGQAYSDQANYYAASKAGVMGFTRILAGELGPDKVTANVVAPGMIRTPRIAASPNGEQRLQDYAATTMLNRAGEIDEVAAAVAFLVSPQAGFITGEIVNLNGGAFMP